MLNSPSIASVTSGSTAPPQIDHIWYMIEHGKLTCAIDEVRSLPDTLPGLPRAMGALILMSAWASRHSTTTQLTAEMLQRFPMSPEIVDTLSGLADILAAQDAVLRVVHQIGRTLATSYALDEDSLLEWMRRLAYRLRRSGSHRASELLLQAWKTRPPQGPEAARGRQNDISA